MPTSNHPAVHNAIRTVPRSVPQVALAMGGVGAVIGGSAAAAKNIREVREGRISRDAAVRNTIRETAGAGLSTATATAVVGAVGATGFLSLLGIVAVATGTKYLWDLATVPIHGVAEPSPKPKPAKGARQTKKDS